MVHWRLVVSLHMGLSRMPVANLANLDPGLGRVAVHRAVNAQGTR